MVTPLRRYSQAPWHLGPLVSQVPWRLRTKLCHLYNSRHAVGPPTRQGPGPGREKQPEPSLFFLILDFRSALYSWAPYAFGRLSLHDEAVVEKEEGTGTAAPANSRTPHRTRNT